MKVLHTVDAFKELIQEIKTTLNGYKNPLAFGICYIGCNDNKQEAIYPVVNWNENFASAAIFIQALYEQGIKVDFAHNEAVFTINKEFLTQCMNAFTPYCNEISKHKNIQVVSNIYHQMIHDNNLKDLYRVTFIFDGTSLQSMEAKSLKAHAISLEKTS